MPYTPEEAKELLSELTQHRYKLSSQETTIYDRVAKADKVLRLAWFLLFGFIIGVVGVTTFYIRVNNSLDLVDKKLREHEEIFRVREVRISAIEQARQADLISAMARLSLADQMRKDVDKNTIRLDLVEPQNRTMFEMLKRGESNKEAFFIDKGFEPPSFVQPRSNLSPPKNEP